MKTARHNLILDFIPSCPKSISVKSLQALLSQYGVSLFTRMLQRDHQSLYDQGCFGLEKDTRTKPFAWSISKDWRGSSTLLSTELAQHYLLL